LRDWNGRKYCSKPCQTRAQALRDSTKTPEPVSQGTTVNEPKATKEVISLLSESSEGYLNGAPCTDTSCNGVLDLRRGRYGLFFGCTYFFKENRPSSASKCRVTVKYKTAQERISDALVKQAEAKRDAAKATPAPAPVVEAPKPQPKAVPEAPLVSDSMGRKLLAAINKLDAEVRDCIGCVEELKTMVKANVETTGKLRQEVSDIDFKVEQAQSAVTFLKDQLV